MARGEEIRTEVTVQGDVSGQLAVGSNILQMRIDRMLGNVVNVLPPGATPNVTARVGPVRLTPRQPPFMVGRADVADLVLATLSSGRSVDLHAPSGMGKSTLVRHLANVPAVEDACGGVAVVSARDQSRDDLLQALFEVFYSSDVPVRPTPVQVRHYLQTVRAAVFLEDVDLSDDAAAELEEIAPRCPFVRTGARARQSRAARAVPLTGLPVDAAGELLANVLGRAVPAEEESAVHALWGIARGSPAHLIQLASGAARYPESLDAFAADSLQSGPPPMEMDSAEDVRVLGLLAALPGVELDVEQLAVISGVPDVERRLHELCARGLVLAVEPPSAPQPVRVTYCLASGVDLDAVEWRLEERREELTSYFTDWARRNPDVVLVPAASAEPLRMLQDDARRRGMWRSVIALGALLDVAYALSGRWDAWRYAVQASFEAAHALGDSAAEAMALHQLGTGALLRGDLTRAKMLLEAALDLRIALGHSAAAAVTQHNLDTLTLVPPPAFARQGAGRHRYASVKGTLAKIPTSAKAVAVLVPLLGSLSFIGLASAAPNVHFDPQKLGFATEVVHQTSDPQVIRLGNGGRTAMRIDRVGVAGRDQDEFIVLESTCTGEVPAGGNCTTTVVFTPVVEGQREASISWHVQGMSDDLDSPVTGFGEAAKPGAPTVSPDALVFGSRPLNTLSPPQRVRLVAPATGAVDVRTASLEGLQATDFLLDGDDCPPTVLAAGAACTVAVRFAPSVTGARSALLRVKSADGTTAAAVPVSGAGDPVPIIPTVTVAPVPVPVPVPVPPAPVTLPELTPSLLSFGEHPIGEVTPAQIVTVTNRASVPLRLTGVSVAGAANAFRVDSTSCTAKPLGPGASCTIPVRFAPTAAGPQSGVLSVGLAGVAGRSSVALTATAIDPTLHVPNVVGLSQADAQSKIVASGLRVGTVGHRPDPSLALGAVVSTKPAAGATAATGAPVDLVLSDGPAKVGVPNVIGRPVDAAGKLLTGAKLKVGDVVEQFSDTVAKGLVISSNPGPNAQVDPGYAVGLTVSRGPQPIAVPDCGGDVNTVEARIAAAGLKLGEVTKRSDPQVPAGNVLACSPDAGASVQKGTRVDLTVSTGPVVQVPVPDVSGSSVAVATRILKTVGLRAGKLDPQPSDTVANGVVIGSNPAKDTPVDPGYAVGLTVSTGPPRTVVPDCTGDEAAVEQRLGDAHLGLGVVTKKADPDVPAGQVISCEPATGTKVDQQKQVALVVSTGLEVPNVVGMTVDEATSTLATWHLALGEVTYDAQSTATAGQVTVSTPAAGMPATPGMTVAITIAGPSPLQ